jgi:NAD+ kinase
MVTSFRSIQKTNRPIDTVGFFARPDRKLALSTAVSAAEFLAERGIDVLLDTEIAAYKGDRDKGVPLGEMKADLLVVIGGDGTILKASMNNSSEIPILGVKVGTGGFLTEVAPRDASSALQRCLDGNYLTEVCLKIESSLNGRVLPDALNEVLLTSSESSRLMSSRVSYTQFEIELRSDSLIVSTPTGSTAHSLSAGGPILNMGVDSLVLTPICSLSPIRPMVFPFKDALNIELQRNSPVAEIVVDGMPSSPFHPKDRLILGKSPRRAFFIRFREDFFVRRVSRRLYT